MTKLFVGNLPYSTGDEQLGEMFKPFGEIASATVVMDKYTNRSRGFGFVEMQNDEEAKKAIQELDGNEIDGRKIAVSVAKPREERPER